MVPDAGCRLRREKVAAGGLEEFQHRLVFKRGRVGEVDHHLRAGHGLGEALAGDGVDAGIGRGGDDLVAALAQDGDCLRPDQAGTADNDDLHVPFPLFRFAVFAALARRSLVHVPARVLLIGPSTVPHVSVHGFSTKRKSAHSLRCTTMTLKGWTVPSGRTIGSSRVARAIERWSIERSLMLRLRARQKVTYRIESTSATTSDPETESAWAAGSPRRSGLDHSGTKALSEARPLRSALSRSRRLLDDRRGLPRMRQERDVARRDLARHRADPLRVEPLELRVDCPVL